jgi:hypothetical protein
MTPSHQYLSTNTITHHHLKTHTIQHHLIKSQMRKYSKRQQLIRDLFFPYVLHYTNYMDDQILSISQSPQKHPQLKLDESQFFFVTSLCYARSMIFFTVILTKYWI